MDPNPTIALSGAKSFPGIAYGQALALYKQEGHRLGQADVLRDLGELESHLGRNDQARDAYSQALALFRQVGNRLGQADVLYGLGDLETNTNPELARQYFYHASQLCTELGLSDLAADALEKAKKIGGEDEKPAGRRKPFPP